MIEARHAGHHHSNDHAKTGLLFLVCALSAMVLYSIVCLIYGRVRSKRPFSWPRPTWAIAAVWVGLVLAAFIRHHDFDSIAWCARRAGRIGYAAAIFSQFLVLKPAVLAKTYTVGLTFCHKWTGRTAVVLAALHGMLYTIAYIKHETFSKLFTVLANVWGIVALTCYTIIGVLSLKFIRRRWYTLFYVPHVPLSFLATVLVLFHARPSAAVLCEMSIFISLMAIIFRISTSRPGTASVGYVSANFDVVTLNRSVVSTSDFPAGAHVRLSKNLGSASAWIMPSHPYTIASLSSDQDIKLVLKRTRWQVQNSETYSVQGPFLCPYEATKYSKVIAIGGGAGISFVAPVWRSAVGSETQVKAVWVTRSHEDLAVLPQIGLDECDVYITRGPNTESFSQDTPDASAFELDDIEPEEDQDNTQLLPKDQQQSTLGQGVTQNKGRPVFSEAFNAFIGETPSSDVSVVACGPEALIRDVKAWAHANSYDFFAEEYST